MHPSRWRGGCHRLRHRDSCWRFGGRCTRCHWTVSSFFATTVATIPALCTLAALRVFITFIPFTAPLRALVSLPPLAATFPPFRALRTVAAFTTLCTGSALPAFRTRPVAPFASFRALRTFTALPALRARRTFTASPAAIRTAAPSLRPHLRVRIQRRASGAPRLTQFRLTVILLFVV